jgi:enamine deaminase RidA (YjgF/YER057c/UK114 family)
MTWRSLAAAILAACVVGSNNCPAAEESTKPTPGTPRGYPAGSSSRMGVSPVTIQYIPLDAPAGMSQAVIVQGLPLVHTRQLLPLDTAGELVGEGSADKQIEQVLNNLDAVLKDSGSDLRILVRLNVYALAPNIVARTRELLSQRLGPSVRPAITSILTPLPHRKALVAVDAVAAATRAPREAGSRMVPDRGKGVKLLRSGAVAGDSNCADAAVLPRGGVAYLSGQPDDAGLTESAVTRSMSNLMKTLGHMKLSPAHVVQVKVFLRPITSAEAVRREVQTFFPGQLTPPVVFVEWLAAVPVEIEMIAGYPLAGVPPSEVGRTSRPVGRASRPSDPIAEDVEYFTPPEVRPSNIFSKAALVRTDRQIYLSGLFARVPSRGEPQGKYVFEQLQEVLDKTGSDMRHLVKGTYYVCDDDAARWVDRTRPRVFDPDRPPAASKVMVHGMTMEGRTMTVDMIAVGRK